MIAMEGVEPWSRPEKKRKEDLVIDKEYCSRIYPLQLPVFLVNLMCCGGMEDGLILDLIFDNVYINGTRIDSIDHFYHNEYVLN